MVRILLFFKMEVRLHFAKKRLPMKKPFLIALISVMLVGGCFLKNNHRKDVILPKMPTKVELEGNQNHPHYGYYPYIPDTAKRYSALPGDTHR